MTPYTIEGPIGFPGHVFGGFADTEVLAQHGYVEEEYFIAGTATPFVPVGELTPDGRWTTERGPEQPFRTRVIVHRPLDAARFNGLVMAEWSNVSTFNDISNAVNEVFYRDGYVYAAITTQRAAIHGLDSEENTGLRRLQPDRYSTLDVPGDDLSYDIFSAVAHCLMRSAPTGGAELLPGLAPRHLIATGESQSSARLVSYINAVYQHDHVVSAFAPCVMVGGGSELYAAEIVPGESKQDYNRRFFSRIVPTAIRTDQAVPVLIMQSETEARMGRLQAQPDSEWLRVWELAGSVHGSSCDTGYRPDVSARDGVRDPFARGTAKMVRFMPTMAAAGIALAEWADRGRPLPAHPRLQRGDEPGSLRRDEYGNVLGGVRLPEVEAPVAVYDSMANPAMGTRTPLPADVVRSLYPTRDDYVAGVRAAADICVAGGVLTAVDAERYVRAAVDEDFAGEQQWPEP